MKTWWLFLEGFVDGMARLAPIATAVVVLLLFLTFCSSVNISIRITSIPVATEVAE